MAVVNVNGLTIGKGMPKIAVPIVAKTHSAIIAAAKQAITTPLDLVEWRADFFNQLTDPQAVADLATQLRQILAPHPLLVTIRTAKEGGNSAISAADYLRIYEQIITEHAADMIDLEVLQGDGLVEKLTTTAHREGIKVVMSNHDFQQTPSATSLLALLGKMTTLDADIVKFAVMPHTIDDLLTILMVNAHYASLLTSKPVIAIGMGPLGKIVRVGGETFGSCISFGSVGQASAPGQVEVDKLKMILTELHN